MRAWVLVAILGCIPSVASAQGLFLQKGTSGYGADLGVSTDGGFIGVGATAGFSYEGWADAFLSVNGTRLDPDNWDGDVVAAYGIAPGIGLHPIKQGGSIPLSIALGADVGWYTFSGVDGASAWTVETWGTLYRFFKLGSNYGVIPGAQFTYAHTETQVYDLSAGSDDFSVALGGHCAYLLDSGYILTLTPGITLGSEAPVFSLTIGAIRAMP